MGHTSINLIDSDVSFVLHPSTLIIIQHYKTKPYLQSTSTSRRKSVDNLQFPFSHFPTDQFTCLQEYWSSKTAKETHSTIKLYWFQPEITIFFSFWHFGRMKTARPFYRLIGVRMCLSNECYRFNNFKCLRRQLLNGVNGLINLMHSKIKLMSIFTP